MEKEYYIIIKMMNLKEIDMKVILKMIKQMEKEYYFGMMGIDMKENLKMIYQKEKEHFI